MHFFPSPKLESTISGLSNFVNESKTETFISRQTLNMKLSPSLKEQAKNVFKLRDNAF